MTIVGHELAEIFINWFPMIVLVGIWIFFIRRLKFGPTQKEAIEIQRRQAEAMERIAIALEKRD